MFNFWNWKFNPFTQLFNPANVVGEQHIVAYDEDANAYGIRLHNLIELQGSLPFNTNINYSIYEDVTGGAKLTETPRTNPPDAGQFRVDYSANTYFSTSFIEFNSADNGLAVIVNYRQLGTVVKTRYQLLSSVIFPANVGIEGNLDVTDNVTVGIDLTVSGNSQISGSENVSGNFTALGDVSLAETTGSTINLNDKQASNMGDPVDGQDGVNLRSMGSASRYDFRTSSGSITVGIGVTLMLVELAGTGGVGGAGGGNNNGGGGGGGSSKQIESITVSPGQVLTLTLGLTSTLTGSSPTVNISVGPGSAGGAANGVVGGVGGAGSGNFGQAGSSGSTSNPGSNAGNGGCGGGAGGAGGLSTSTSAGNPGSAGNYGGGGGGGSGGGSQTGGAGGAPYCILRW